jgi:hypothetical protein
VVASSAIGGHTSTIPSRAHRTAQIASDGSRSTAIRARTSRPLLHEELPVAKHLAESLPKPPLLVLRRDALDLGHPGHVACLPGEVVLRLIGLRPTRLVTGLLDCGGKEVLSDVVRPQSSPAQVGVEAGVLRGVALDLGMLVRRDVLAPESLIETDAVVLLDDALLRLAPHLRSPQYVPVRFPNSGASSV